ncbi:MAG: sugar transferase, partial [Solirubrobacteraceae bacterium]
LDLVLALLLLASLTPLLALIALLIRLDSRGSPFFRQTRVGRGGRCFTVVKFRTMVSDAERRIEQLRAQSKDPNWLHLDHDPRITRVGRLLRYTSLDELPQLWNVVRGQMSLVGPRPLTVADDANVPAWARARTAVAPGMTGLWQVSGRTEVSFQDMLRLDNEYASGCSFAGDMWLLLRTIPAVLFARGAN